MVPRFLVGPVPRCVEGLRDKRYSLLRGYFRGANGLDEEGSEQVRLQSVLIDGSADAVGHRLDEPELFEMGVEFTAIRRHGIRGVEPDRETKPRATLSCCADCLVRWQSPKSGGCARVAAR